MNNCDHIPQKMQTGLRLRLNVNCSFLPPAVLLLSCAAALQQRQRSGEWLRWQVLGAPVAGSDVRASVATGGGLRLRGLVPAVRSRRLQMIFPLRGADRRGLVSLEAKKRKVVMACVCMLD